MDDTAIRSVVNRLARPHASGGDVVERAAIIAEGADSPAILAWVVAHADLAEGAASRSGGSGLHGSRMGSAGGSEPRNPMRFVLPAGVCGIQPEGLQ
jgi:hypothetical protein